MYNKHNKEHCWRNHEASLYVKRYGHFYSWKHFEFSQCRKERQRLILIGRIVPKGVKRAEIA